MMSPERFVHYTIGHTEIDSEHWEIFTLVGQICGLLKTYKFDQAAPIVLKLKTVQMAHESTEMEFMQAIKYPYIKPHGDDHAILIAKIIRFAYDITSPKRVSAQQIADFETMILDHVDHYDRQIMDYVRKNNITTDYHPLTMA